MAHNHLPTAGCPGCGAPLIWSLHFRCAEFYCLECGRHVGFLEPVKLDAEANEARYQALKAEWDEHAASRLIHEGNVRLGACQLCADGPHIEHATEEEHAAHEAAMAWLKTRASSTDPQTGVSR